MIITPRLIFSVGHIPVQLLIDQVPIAGYRLEVRR